MSILNANGLNVPNKRQKLSDWKKTRTQLCDTYKKQETHFICKDIGRLKVKS